MKKLILFFPIAVIVGCVSFAATDPKLLNQPFQYVFTFDKMKKDILFDKSLEWAAETFVSSNDVIQLKDKQGGKIMGRGSGAFPDIVCSRKYLYGLKIEIKDEKVRLTFDNYQPVDYYDSTGQHVAGQPITYQRYYDLVKIDFDSMSAKYETYIKKTDATF